MTIEKKQALIHARQKRCYEKHKDERLVYQRSYYEEHRESIKIKTKLRRIYGDDWARHYTGGESQITGGLRMFEIEKKWPGWKIITNQSALCVKCGKRITEGVLAHCNPQETEMVCEVCYGELRDKAEKMGSL